VKTGSPPADFVCVSVAIGTGRRDDFIGGGKPPIPPVCCNVQVAISEPRYWDMIARLFLRYFIRLEGKGTGTLVLVSNGGLVVCDVMKFAQSVVCFGCQPESEVGSALHSSSVNWKAGKYSLTA
jgi:hypothetical protein